MEISAQIDAILKTLPEKPGVYQYFDADDTILYVGKAKSLKKRVSSYFHKEHDNARLRILVRKIANIKTIVVNTEYDALLLENNLIKQYQPRYNIALKDDKTYPWLCIKKEPFPRFFSTRTKINDGSEYSSAATLYPDAEDLNRDNTLNETEEYFQYEDLTSFKM